MSWQGALTSTSSRKADRHLCVILGLHALIQEPLLSSSRCRAGTACAEDMTVSGPAQPSALRGSQSTGKGVTS